MSRAEELAEIVERVRSATACLTGNDEQLRSIAFERLLAAEVVPRHAEDEVELNQNKQRQPEERVNPWNMETWTPEERLVDLAMRWSIEPRRVRGIVDPTPDEPRLCLASAALSADADDAIRQVALLLTSARVDSLYNTNVTQVREAAADYGLESERVEPVLAAMHKTTILLVDLRPEGPRDIYLLPAGNDLATAMAQKLTANGG